jgi:hypothetical protein
VSIPPIPTDRVLEVIATCPRCHITDTIPLLLSTVLTQTNDGVTLAIRSASKKRDHICHQLPLTGPGTGTLWVDQATGELREDAR